METALLAALAALTGCMGLGVIEWRERGLRRLQTVRLGFGRDVTPEAMAAVIDRLAGLRSASTVILDLHADHRGVTHYLHAEPATLATLRGGLRALLPSLRFEAVSAPDLDGYRWGRSIRLRGRMDVLRDDGAPEVSTALLAAMQPLGRNERLLLRWLIRPDRPHSVPPASGRQSIEPEERRRLRTKNAGSVVRGRGLIAAAAGHPRRAAHLLGRVSAALRSRATAYGYLQLQPRGGAWLGHDLSRQGFLFGDRYAAQELAPLLAWPIGAPVLAGVSLGTSPQLLPSERLPRRGRVLGRATWPGAERPVAQPLLGALSHSLIAGPTGVGKSTLLTNLIADDLADGRGAVLIDGKGDTASAVLGRIPQERQGDVIVLDCGVAGPQPGLTLFSGHDAELAADVVLGVLADLFHDSWGPLSERYLRAGLAATAHDPAGTLADVPFVYSDAAYRRRLLGQLRDPLSRGTLAGFDAMGAGERQQQLAAPLNKLGTLLGRPIVRTVLGQNEPKLDFRAVLRRQGMVVISLAPARVGAPAARLIGALSLFALFQAVQGRSTLPEGRRRPFLIYIDEPKALGDVPMPLDALLEQARGLGVGVTLAPQSIAQLPKAVREAALTNVATRIVFRQQADDARLLARDLGGVTPEELGDLGPYEAVARIGLGPGDVAPPVTLKTAPLAKPTSDPRIVREASAARYGVSLGDVDAALDARHQPAAAAPVGRKRRAP